MIKEMKNYIKLKKLNFIEPIDIDENTICKGTLIYRTFEIPSEPGVYIYFNKNKEIMYVGKSTNLRVRYRQHNNESVSKVLIAKRACNDNIKYYAYATCKTVQEAEMMEMVYTYIYKPKLIYLSKSEINELKIG